MNKEAIVLEYKGVKEKYGTANAVSHMLRTSITCILSFGELLNFTTLTAKQKKYIQNITQSAYQLVAITELLIQEISSNKQCDENHKDKKCQHIQ